MNVSVPVNVDDNVLTSSTIPEVGTDFSEAAWDGVTSYSLNDIRYQGLILYISLRNNNLNNDPANDVAAGDGKRGAFWKIFGYRLWNIATPYTSGEFATLNGEHQVYQALKDSTGVNPRDDIGDNARGTGEFWQKAFPTQKFAMFDNLNGSQSEWFLTATVRLTPRQVYNSAAVFGLSSSSQVDFTQVDPTAGTTYTKSVNTRDITEVVNFYQFITYEVRNSREFILDDLPTKPRAYLDVTFSVNQGSNYQGIWAELTGSGTADNYSVSHNGSIWNLINSVADVTASEPSVINDDWAIVGDSDVKVGSLLVGQVFQLGTSTTGTSGQSLDFSTKERDEFGNFIVVPRDTSKNIDFRAFTETSRINYVRSKTDELTTIPCVWFAVGTDALTDPTIVFGYNRDFRFTNQTNKSDFSLLVEGVIE